MLLVAALGLSLAISAVGTTSSDGFSEGRMPTAFPVELYDIFMSLAPFASRVGILAELVITFGWFALWYRGGSALLHAVMALHTVTFGVIVGYSILPMMLVGRATQVLDLDPAALIGGSVAFFGMGTLSGVVGGAANVVWLTLAVRHAYQASWVAAMIQTVLYRIVVVSVIRMVLILPLTAGVAWLIWWLRY